MEKQNPNVQEFFPSTASSQPMIPPHGDEIIPIAAYACEKVQGEQSETNSRNETIATSRAKINFNFLRENIFVKTFAQKHFREKPGVQKAVGSYIPYKGRLSGAVFFSP